MVQNWLKGKFLDKFIDKNKWPPRSPDLNPCDHTLECEKNCTSHPNSNTMIRTRIGMRKMRMHLSRTHLVLIGCSEHPNQIKNPSKYECRMFEMNHIILLYKLAYASIKGNGYS